MLCASLNKTFPSFLHLCWRPEDWSRYSVSLFSLSSGRQCWKDELVLCCARISHTHLTHSCILRCHYTKSNPIDNHSNISSKTLQKQNFKPLGHYTCMQCGTSHLQTVQENILSRIILATYRKFTVTTIRFTQNVS